ncbi:NAD/NADP octopine/nopaline dehydrogenase family protein [Mycobacterium sp. NPDC003449]
MTDQQTFAILGMGNGGHAFAAYLGLRGQRVQVWDVDSARIDELRQIGSVTARGSALTGSATLDVVSSDLEEAVAGAGVILVVIPTMFHASVAEQMAAHVKDDQLVILNPGATGGALEVRGILRRAGAGSITVGETNNMLFTCRSARPGTVLVHAIKDRVDFACLPASATTAAIATLSPVLPQFHAVRNVLLTSLANINAMVHPLPTLLNAARCDTAAPFDYYHEGITPAVASLIERLDKERLEIADAYGVEVQTLPEWYTDSYGRQVETLYDAVHNNVAYTDIAGPTTLQTRYLLEDVATGLVPLSELGRAAGVTTPLIDAAIDLASSLIDVNFRERGRTLARLDLERLSVPEIAAAVA